MEQQMRGQIEGQTEGQPEGQNKWQPEGWLIKMKAHGQAAKDNISPFVARGNAVWHAWALSAWTGPLHCFMKDDFAHA